MDGLCMGAAVDMEESPACIHDGSDALVPTVPLPACDPSAQSVPCTLTLLLACTLVFLPGSLGMAQANVVEM